jgi:hypothetical protein
LCMPVERAEPARTRTASRLDLGKRNRALTLLR